MLFGAHQSIGGGLDQALKRIAAIGGDCLQIFSSSPREWNKPKMLTNPAKFLIPIYFHATYLINLADPGEIGRKSIEMLVAELNFAKEIGVIGSVVHLGSYKNGNALKENMKEVLAKTPKETFLIAENSGTRKIGQTLDELAEIAGWDSRIRICLDTCHLHAAGYHLNDFSLWNKLELVHINDSKDEFGSLRDRHENIGRGKIGTEEFRKVINDPHLKNTPLILEVPGFDGKGPDKMNLDILKSLV